MRMVPQSSGRPDPALSWVRQQRCYQWQLWGHTREEFVLYFPTLIRLKWLVSQHLWSQRKAPRQWKPSKQYLWPPSQLSPLHPSLSNPLASFALDLTLKGQIISIQWGWYFRGRTSTDVLETDLLIGSRQLVKCGIKAPCSGLPGHASSWPWEEQTCGIQIETQPASLNSCLQRHSLPPHQYMFTAPSCCQRGTDFGFLGARGFHVPGHQYQHHSYLLQHRETGLKRLQTLPLLSGSHNCSTSHRCSHAHQSLYYVPGIVLRCQRSRVNKANMTPAFKEFTVQWVSNHKV